MVFCLLLTIITQGNAYAQRTPYWENEPKTFEGGLTFGGSITQVDGDGYAGFNKIGIHTGGLVYVHFNARIGMSMELLYVQKGSRGAHVVESPNIGTYFDKYFLNLNYVEVPLLVHWRPNPLYDFEAGISYARLLRATEWAETDQPVYFDPVLTRFNTADVNYAGGFSYWFSRHWQGGARFQYSVVPIRPWDRVLPRYSSGGGQYNNTVVFRLVYLL